MTDRSISPEFAAKWCDALAAMPELIADQVADIPTSSGGSYRYKYANLAQVLNAARPVLTEHGLAAHQEVHSANDGPAVRTVITCRATGEQMEVGDLTMAASGKAQVVGSAITYARRYALTAALNLAVDDDDGAAASRPAENLLQMPSGKWTNRPTDSRGWANVVKAASLWAVAPNVEMAALDESTAAQTLESARLHYLEVCQEIGAATEADAAGPDVLTDVQAREGLNLIAEWAEPGEGYR